MPVTAAVRLYVKAVTAVATTATTSEPTASGVQRMFATFIPRLGDVGLTGRSSLRPDEGKTLSVCPTWRPPPPPLVFFLRRGNTDSYMRNNSNNPAAAAKACK